jgi:NADPH:quinone reductase-like Zn-dependent oxidoreductase
VERPIPKEHEVLVKVRATAINDYDWSLVRGEPFLYRLMFGFFKPKQAIPGMEVAGTIEEMGSGVTSLSIGDHVFGDLSEYGFGSFAEYVCVHEKALTKKPEGMSFEDAVALPHASLLALQGLRDIGHIAEGDRVLINGAGGGVGTLALQLAKLHGCEVTGVDTGEKLKVMAELGFDRIMDYKVTDFTRTGEQYDLILDCKTTRSSRAYLRALRPSGRYVTVGGHLTALISLFFIGKLLTLFSKKELNILALTPNQGLDTIIDLYLKGNIEPSIDGPYSLEEIPRLIRYFGEGRHHGKVVISL